MSKQDFDLIVVGGGILGTFHAYFALQKGLKVALLERHVQPRGATVRNFGQIVPSGMDAKWRAIGRRSLVHYKELQATFGISLRQEGSLYVASDDLEWQLLEELHARNEAEGYASELWSANRCRDRYPGLRADYCRGGLFYPEEVCVDPRLAVNRVREYLIEQRGLHYFPETTAREVDALPTGVRVSSDHGRRATAERVVVCGGNEVHTLFPQIYGEAGLLVSQLQMLRIAAHPQVNLPGNLLTGETIRRYEAFGELPSWPQVLAERDPESFGQRYGVHILFKQADDGSIILGDSHLYADAHRASELEFDSEEAVDDYIITEAQKIYALPSWRISHRWQGRYTQCKDRDIFQATLDGRIHLVTGIGGKGMTAGPGFAEKNLQKIYND